MYSGLSHTSRPAVVTLLLGRHPGLHLRPGGGVRVVGVCASRGVRLVVPLPGVPHRRLLPDPGQLRSGTGQVRSMNHKASLCLCPVDVRDTYVKIKSRVMHRFVPMDVAKARADMRIK